LSLQILSAIPHTNFWLLFFFKVLNILFFGKMFGLIGRFGVLIIVLGFWVEPANSPGQGQTGHSINALLVIGAFTISHTKCLKWVLLDFFVWNVLGAF
jgi:hypothetical protein